MTDEKEPTVTPDEETLKDAIKPGLSPEEEKKAKEASPADPRLNQAIPVIIAKVIYKSPPTSLLGKDIPPTENSDLAEQYVQSSAPLLELISFHECLGVIATLPPKTRLMIGVGILGLNLLRIKPKEKKVEKAKESSDFEEIGDVPIS